MEPHPWRHNFTDGRVNDEIIETSARNVPIVIRRHQWCEWCGTERIHFLDLIRWERAGGYQYKGRPADLTRMTRQEWLREEFLRTTDLPEKIKKRLPMPKD